MGEYIVIIKDKEGADRGPYREAHLARIPVGFKTLGVVNCGAIFNSDFSKPAGSSFDILADSEAAVKEFLADDPFWKGGVWDQSTLQIVPFKSVGRKGLETKFTQ